MLVKPAIQQRFYPEVLGSFPHEPTRDHFSIEHISAGIGEGVVARVPFASGQVIFAFSGFVSAEITQFSLQIAPGLHLHDPYFMGKILHSCDPNAHVDMTHRLFVARRDILVGDFITMDYAETEDYLFKTFHCRCGAPNCRGEIRGRRQ